MLVASFGFLLRRRFDIQIGPLSTVVFNILSPCLVFSSLAMSELKGSEIVALAGFSAITIFVNGGLAFGLARLLRLNRMDTATFLIVIMFVNGGNYGLTLLQLRYGEEGLSHGIIYYITSTVLVYTVGVLIASMGRVSWRNALKRMARLPAVYAAILAVLAYTFHVSIPAPIMKGISIAGEGAIPMMLIILGAQIADIKTGEPTRLIAPAVSLRLIGGPLIGLAIATIMGLQGLGRSAMIVESAMPTAVITLILSSEFGLPASTVARIVVISTLLSPLTIAAAVTLLGL